jgi:hypothetical protein
MRRCTKWERMAGAGIGADIARGYDIALGARTWTMADGPGGMPPADARAAPDAQALARDWITIWHSEMAALATSREMQEGWLRTLAVWAQAAEAASRLLPSARSAGPAGPHAAAGPAAPMAAPDARDAAIQRLGERIDELERILAQRIGGSRPD